MQNYFNLVMVLGPIIALTMIVKKFRGKQEKTILPVEIVKKSDDELEQLKNEITNLKQELLLRKQTS